VEEDVLVDVELTVVVVVVKSSGQLAKSKQATAATWTLSMRVKKGLLLVSSKTWRRAPRAKWLWPIVTSNETRCMVPMGSTCREETSVPARTMAGPDV
jgi:hypothetical protein